MISRYNGLSVLAFACVACGAASDQAELSVQKSERSALRLPAAELQAAIGICEMGSRISPQLRDIEAPITSSPLCQAGTAPEAWRVTFKVADTSLSDLQPFQALEASSFILPLKKARNHTQPSGNGILYHACTWSNRIDGETYPRLNLQIAYESVAVNGDMQYFASGGHRTDGLSFEIELDANEDAIARFNLDFPAVSTELPLDCSQPYTLPAISIGSSETRDPRDLLQAVITPMAD